ncbi:MAG: PPC domain-containing protein [Planctomycetes bacterium]|nr:PPC domain-containing protein [Planctomycetota bacterium]
MRNRLAPWLFLFVPVFAAANPPSASYIFPAGGQRGTKVAVRVGGLFLHQKCGFEMLGPGIKAPAFLTRATTTWFEGPLLPLPDSQRQEDYPKDMAGTLDITASATPGIYAWRVWTAQGATPSMKFQVGDLPEIVENEIDGDPVPAKVTLPVTINGRIFPREDIDVYSFSARKGQSVRCEVHAARLGSPLDARLEVRDSQGRRIAESDAPTGGDPVLRFTAPADGEYHIRIDDVRRTGGQAFVYRLTLSSDLHVERVYPLGGQRGKSVDFEIVGQNAPPRITHVMRKQADAGRHLDHFKIGTKYSNPALLDLDEFPEFVFEKDATKAIAYPAVLNGRIAKPGDVNPWKLQGKKGDTWNVDLRATRLGSRLDGVVTILDSAGKQMARAEAGANDPSLTFKVPADGAYTVQVQDRFRSRGGPEFAYRLRIAPPEKVGFRLWLASDAVTVPRKGTGKLKLNVDRLGGFKEPIRLTVQGLPKGVTVAPAQINANQTTVDLTFKADDSAKIAATRLMILGVGKIAGADSNRTAKLRRAPGAHTVDSVRLAVALPTPFVIKGVYDMGFAPRGGIHKRTYKIERNGFDGPIVVSLTDKQARHLQGVTGPTITVPAGVSNFTYSAFLPPWMETGRTCRVCVMGVGVVKEPDGSLHEVSFSSVNQNEQLVCVVGPGRLALETERTSYTAIPGKQFTIAVKINRGQGVQGPVELELVTPSHLRGLTGMKATVGAKEARGQLIITCDKTLSGPFNMPVIVRATLRQNGEPIVAEARLDVQP